MSELVSHRTRWTSVQLNRSKKNVISLLFTRHDTPRNIELNLPTFRLFRMPYITMQKEGGARTSSQPWLLLKRHCPPWAAYN